MKNNRTSKSFVGLAAGVALALAASSAFGGEITGNGKSLQIAPHTLNGNSSCAFSGRQDDPSTALDEGFKGVMAQSWGQLVKAVRDSFGINPGFACNPTKSAGEP